MNRCFILLLAILFTSISIHAQGELAEISLEIPTVAAEPGDEICLDLTSADFDGIVGLSFTLLYDSNALEYIEIKDINVPIASFEQSFNVETGRIRMLWYGESRDYPNPFSLLTICFKVTGTQGSIVPIQFADAPLGVEIVTDIGATSEEFVQGKFTNGAVWIQSDPLPDIPEIEGAISIFACEELWKSQLDVSISGGVAPYQYSWSGPRDFVSTEEDLYNLNFGVYTLTVTDQNQSKSFATFYIVKPQSYGNPPPLIDSLVLIPYFNCISPDGGVELFLSQESDTYSFNWSNGATTQHIFDVSPGDYEVTITDSRGCVDEWSGTVPDSSQFEIALEVEPAVCVQNQGKITVVSPIGDTYDYTWSDGSNGATLESVSPGVYGLTVVNTSSGCAEVSSATVGQEGVIPVTAEVTDPKCDGTPGSIQLQLPNESMSIQWNTGDQTALASNLPVGNYTVTITDLNGGCVQEQQFTLNVPAVEVSMQTACQLSETAPDSVYATITPITGAGPFTFNWNNGETTMNDGPSTMGAPLPAILFATVTDQNGCVGYPAPSELCREEDQQNNFNTTLYYECDGEPFYAAYIREGGVAPYTFTWSNGFQETGAQSTPVPISSVGFTSVTITDAEGTKDILLGYPLPGNTCQGTEDMVEVIIPDTIVEVDEPFTLPILLNSTVLLEDLIFEVHWDARRLQLDDISGTGLSLNASIAEINSTGKAQLTFDFRSGQPTGEDLAELKFTPKGTTEEQIPVLLGYTRWTAAGNGFNYFIKPDHGSVTLLTDGEKVWPGDTDQSKVVDHRDLLNIGLGYNKMGPVRPNASLEWEGQYSTSWEVETPETNVDYKHADTNGDGLISAADTMAIAQNWSLMTTHQQEPAVEKSDGVPLLIEGNMISSSQDNTLPIILGTTDQEAENIYGLAFSVSYQGAISNENVRVVFTNSWLGQDGTPLLTIYRHFPIQKRIDIALVRTNGQSISGFGTIAELILRGNNQTDMLQTAVVETLDTRMIDEQEQLLQTALESTQLEVDFSSGINEPAWARSIQLVPVPALTELHLHADGIPIEGLQVLNLQGQIMASYPALRVLPVHTYTPGLYLLRIQTPKGVVVRRWVKQ